jgi:hypothetical protein
VKMEAWSKYWLTKSNIEDIRTPVGRSFSSGHS